MNELGNVKQSFADAELDNPNAPTACPICHKPETKTVMVRNDHHLLYFRCHACHNLRTETHDRIGGSTLHDGELIA